MSPAWKNGPALSYHAQSLIEVFLGLYSHADNAVLDCLYNVCLPVHAWSTGQVIGHTHMSCMWPANLNIFRIYTAQYIEHKTDIRMYP